MRTLLKENVLMILYFTMMIAIVIVAYIFG
jgi:hypothetical protein